jgi:hypothetical protein
MHRREAMKKTGSVLCLSVLVALGTTQTHALEWTAEKHIDSFTDIETCKVMPGSEFSRAFVFGTVEGLMHWYAVSYFFAERRGDEVRAGFTNDKNLPIMSDIQVRVDQNPAVTITAADTPIDTGPSIAIPQMQGVTPEVKAQIEQSMKGALARMSPYRVFAGEKAVALLRQIVNGKRAIWRSIGGVNNASEDVTEIRIDGLSDALSECGIAL